MIKILYRKTEDSFKLKITGHAGYAKKGEDVVCAGISTLYFTLGNYLEKNCDHFSCIENRNGNAELLAYGKEAVAALDVILTGFEMMQAEYPENIQVAEGVGYYF